MQRALKALKDNKSLTHLSLNRKDIKYSDVPILIEALEDNKSLTTLDLSANRIGNKGAAALEALKENKFLTTLKLSANNIDDEGAAALAEAMKDNKSLTTLDLNDNGIGGKGAAALVETLKDNKSLTTLKLSANDIDDEGSVALAEALKENKSLTTLDLGRNDIDDEGSVALAEALKENKSLTTLDLGRNDIDDEGAGGLAEALKENKSLTTLDISANGIGNKGAAALVEALKENKSLTTLKLSANDIDDEGAAALAEALKDNKSLTTLDLSVNSIGDEGATALAEALKENQSLTTLKLARNKIDFGGVTALVEALKENKSLTTLDLSANDINDESATALAEALKDNKSLTTLDLSANDIEDEGAGRLAEALKDNESLTTLDLSANGISDEGATALAEVLKENKSLTTLDLSTNDIDDEGAAAVAEALKENLLIHDLHLDENFDMAIQGKIKDLLNRNANYKRHEILAEQQGVSFYFELGENTETKIKETVWEAILLDGVACLHSALKSYQDHAAANNAEGRKNNIRELINEARNDDGSSFLHVIAGLESKVALEFCKYLVETIGADFHFITDKLGRTAQVIAHGNNSMAQWARSVGTFLGRYYIKGGLCAYPVHKSATCTVHFAVDTTKTKGDPDRNVALKIMDDEEQFVRELTQRVDNLVPDDISSCEDCEILVRDKEQKIIDNRNKFDEDYVVNLLRFHKKCDKDGNYYRCLVMQKGNRNLDEIIRSERIAGLDKDTIKFISKDIAKALQHLHSKRIIHGDFKPRNIVRINSRYKLIDFDAATEVGKKLTQKFSTAFISPEVAKVVFPSRNDSFESIEELQLTLKSRENELRDVIAKYDIDGISEKSSQVQKVLKRIEQVKSSSTENVLAANIQMDIWSYGVVMYEMLTGLSLFECDVYDNMTTAKGKDLLANWTGIEKFEKFEKNALDFVLHECKKCDQEYKESAKEFLRKCLDQSSERFTSMDDVCDHCFLTRNTNKILTDMTNDMAHDLC